MSLLTYHDFDVNCGSCCDGAEQMLDWWRAKVYLAKKSLCAHKKVLGNIIGVAKRILCVWRWLYWYCRRFSYRI